MTHFSKAYRNEIDGLRAIAVFSVILYHAQIVLFGRDWFEGGFVGVDIFFVISGYLITRIILSELQLTNSFSFYKFYERRARRILPMLFLVITICIPFAWQSFLPMDLVDFAKSALSSIGFSSNFFFYYSTTEYGTDSALLKPLLHTWSLGVEEQFYIVVPIVILLIWKYARPFLLTIFIAMLVMSIQFADVMEGRNSDLNFFLPFSRFWELLVGSTLAFIELRYGRIKSQLLSQTLPIIGLFLIAHSIIFFDAKTPHPSFQTIVPIIGVILVLVFSSKDDLVGKMLSIRPFVTAGKISYSLYLWHFPIFAFSRKSHDLSNFDKFSLIFLSFLISLVTYSLIEKPFRNNDKIKTNIFIISMGLLASFSILFSFYVIKFEGIDERFNKYLIKSDIELNNETLRKNSWSLVHRHLNSPNYTNSFSKKALIIGNSHAKDLFNAFSQNSSKFENIEFFISYSDADFQINCFDESIVETLDIRDEFYNSEIYKLSDVIIVSTKWRHADRCKAKGVWPKSDDIKGLENLIQKVLSDSKKVIIFSQTPIFKKYLSEKLVVDELIKNWSPNDISDFEQFAQMSSLIKYEMIDWELTNIVNKELNELAAKFDVPIFEKFKFICVENAKTCQTLSSNKKKYFYDNHHYSLSGAKDFGSKLALDHEFMTTLNSK